MRNLAYFLMLLLAACGGGGGGGGGYTVSVDRSSIGEDVEVGRSKRARLQASFDGDGLVIGYPPGVSEPDWLSVTASGNSSPAAVELEFYAGGLSPGTYRTTLRFITGNRAATETAYKDLPVNMTVVDTLRFTNPRGLDQFSSLAGVAASPQSLQIFAASDWRLEVEYQGSERDWLTLSATSGQEQNGNATIQITPSGVQAGSHSAHLKLLNNAGVQQDWVRVNYYAGTGVYLSSEAKQLTAEVTPADLVWTAALTSDYGEPGQLLNWTLHSDADWIDTVSASGNLQGNQTLELALNPEALLSLENGWHESNIRLEFEDAIAPVELTMQLFLALEHAFEFAEPFNLYVDSLSVDGALEGSVPVILAAGGAFQNAAVSWVATTNADWLTIENDRGDTAGNNILTVRIDKAKLANLPNGDNLAPVMLHSSHPRFDDSEHPVTLNLQLPSVDAVGPYVAFSGSSSPLVIQGSGFNANTDTSVHIGDYPMAAEYVSPTQLRMQLPDNLAVDSYNVRVDNALGLPRSRATLKVLESPSYTSARVSLPKPHRRITLDAERQALLFTGSTSDQLDRLQLNALGEWEHSSFPMGDLSAVELTIDGEELLAAVAGTSITDSILRIDPTTLELLGSSSPPDDFYSRYNLILPTLDGQTLIIDSDQWPRGYYYPEWESFFPPSQHSTRAFLARDRSLFIAGGSNNRGSGYVFDAANQRFVDYILGTVFFRQNSVSMSTDASRVVIGTRVYDQNYDLIGSLSPADYVQSLAVSPDGKSVFTMRRVDDVATFFRHDISSDTGPYPPDAETLPLSLGEREYVAHMIVSDDGRALYVLCTKAEWGEYSASSSVLYVVPLD